MDALLASYGDSDSDSDSNSSTPVSIPPQNPPPSQSPSPSPLPPPPLALLTPPNSLLGIIDNLQTGQPARVRSFPHVEGNYAVHVYIPVFIPQPARKEASQFVKKVSSNVPGLHVIDADIPLKNISNDDQKLEDIALGREFHISLGRTVPIRVHQIDSVVTMLRQKLQIQKRYWIDFNKWEVFVNDDHTRAFLSLEVTTRGLPEITKQIQAVNEAYRLHNLPEFYKDPRPHISLTWASGDTSDLLRRVVEEAKKHPDGRNSLQKRVFTAKFSGIECKIGSKTYKICKLPDE
ncbi:U6 snRNA phosphodiesterase-like [Chenopodium quinoa]|uniref:U6 snRNA phosphodiesterase-like n=1 Tax=Chenopodium quinoa TaxID=63459 RepID=UPI000B78CED2|nr:U6 snRNA phosphodiesterase-like [Chenopodium quinoa]